MGRTYKRAPRAQPARNDACANSGPHGVLLTQEGRGSHSCFPPVIAAPQRSRCVAAENETLYYTGVQLTLVSLPLSFVWSLPAQSARC